MKAMKALIRVSVALALGLSLSAPSYARQDEAGRLDQKVIGLYQAGKYAAALPLAQQSLAIREKALGPNHLDVATSLNHLARLRLRPTRRVYWRSHSGGSGALIDAFIDDGHTTAWPCQVVSRLPSGTSPLMALTVQSNASVNRQSAN